ncbi:MAG: hypothetical protein ACK41T_09855 [Pseudobdellovibrio sp.]
MFKILLSLLPLFFGSKSISDVETSKSTNLILNNDLTGLLGDLKDLKKDIKDSTKYIVTSLAVVSLFLVIIAHFFTQLETFMSSTYQNAPVLMMSIYGLLMLILASVMYSSYRKNMMEDNQSPKINTERFPSLEGSKSLASKFDEEKIMNSVGGAVANAVSGFRNGYTNVYHKNELHKRSLHHADSMNTSNQYYET